ncbi:MAG: response regulator [Prolixibacteraceae bacterium]|nr:response regulator [Prolixibacteraceae bacterium]
MKIFIKYMVSNRCKMAVKEELKKLGLHFVVVDLGEVEIMENISVDQRKQLKKALLTSGLELIDDHKAVLIEKIKAIIIEMVHHSEDRIKTNLSDYLAEKLDYDYTYLSNLFSEVQGTTIAQFVISNKIELIKELMIYDELSIKEIAWKMNYSSVAHLSNQFKKISGFSPSHFKKLKDKRRSPIEEIGKQNTEYIADDLPNTSAITTLETKKTEDSQYARSLIEASLDPLVTISAEGKITDMNEATVTITGVTREFLTGTDFFDYFTEPHKAREVYKEVFAKGSVADSPLTLRHINGKLTDVLFNGSIYKDDRGTVQGVVIVARDVTQQKRIATELTAAIVSAELATLIAEEAKLKAESATIIAKDAVKAKQQFLSNMSHEIRTPMNAIIGFTKVLLKTNISAKQKEYLQAIKLSGDALIVLINDILDLAKVDAGKMTFEQIPFKMARSISAMLHLFQTKIQEKNLKLEKEYDSRIPEVLLGDPVRLNQIVLNLVSNAVKFTSKGKITVSVKLLDEDEKEASIEFAVTDTGIGIPAAKIEKIFENFQQASSGTSRIYGGTGLGLAIVKQLVEAQNGNIHVSSKENEGSTFSFVLKFQKTNNEIEFESEPTEPDINISGIKVLVAEDIALNQLLMRTLLEDFGFECDIAENGKIAVAKIQAQKYEVILMDLQMPEMNGFEATNFIRNELKSAIPIIALTADVTTVDLARCKAVGMNDYIAKPVDEKLLYSKIIGIVNKTSKGTDAEIGLQPDGIKNKCTNLSYLNTRTKSNPALMMEMISLYLEQIPPLVIAMKEGYKDSDWDKLYAAVHKLIPSFSIMGIGAEFEKMAQKVQKYARNHKQSRRMPAMILQLEKVFMQSCNELKEELTHLKTQKQ